LGALSSAAPPAHRIMIFPDLQIIRDSVVSSVGEEMAQYVEKVEEVTRRVKSIEAKLDRLIVILEPISKAIKKIPFLK
jgi:tetrahydromethanopterin S-methyltransferase subunit B